jgi:hypothetical protein
MIPILGNIIFQKEHYAKFVCSALSTALHVADGMLMGINWTQVEPKWWAEANLYVDWLPLLGNPKLPEFNSVG